MKKRALLIFTSNLRVLDNHIFKFAKSDEFDIMGITFINADRSDLQKNIQTTSALEVQEKFHIKNLPFLILNGELDISIISEFVHCHNIDAVYIQDSYNSRGKIEIQKLHKKLGNKLQTFFQQTLIDINDLPFTIQDTPLVFTQFKKLVLNQISIQTPLHTELADYSGFDVQLSEAIKDLQFNKTNFQSREIAFGLAAGETAALQRLQDYFWNTQSIQNYKNTRNGMVDLNDSSKLSIGLSYGCISARKIYSELQKFENLYGKNESTEWYLLELLWRDYFKFLALKIGPQLFSRNGLKEKKANFEMDPVLFSQWQHGRTGQDFVDANMNELNKTGWMSNRGRQNVASFLAKTLNIDWTLGADYFQKNLLDDDVESNWGNWLYLAGVGTDPRDRVFNVQRQADMYDADRKYRNRWL